jgi:putative mRNA 3-end processing factor
VAERSALIGAGPAGLHCAAGGFHIDPLRPVETAVITHAHADHARPGSRRYFATRAGLPLLRARLGRSAELIPLDYGEQIRLGGARVSLHPAGHILGSAQVRIECGGEVWVASGDYKRDADPTCAPFEVLPCDTFITEATFAAPIYRWPPASQVAAQVLSWWRQQSGRGNCVLFCYSLGKAQRLLAELGALGEAPLYLHPAVEELTALYRAAGVALPATRRLPEADAKLRGALVLAPPGAAGGDWLRRLDPVSTAFASGWMASASARRQRGYARSFVLSDHADWPGLLSTIRATGAQRVRVHHGDGRALARYLREVDGVDAAALAG